MKMEKFLRQTLQDHKNYQLIMLEYDVFANQSLARQFNVGTTTIILVERKDRQNERVRDLTAEVWENIKDESAFLELLQKELEQFADQSFAAFRSPASP